MRSAKPYKRNASPSATESLNSARLCRLLPAGRKNDYLLKEAANAKPTYKIVKGKRVYEKSVPVYLQSVSNLCNQLLRAGTSIGANNAEATNAVSKTDYRAKSFIALKEARESLYWIELLHRNKYIDDKQYQSIYTDCEELVKILVARCKKINQELDDK